MLQIIIPDIIDASDGPVVLAGNLKETNKEVMKNAMRFCQAEVIQTNFIGEALSI